MKTEKVKVYYEGQIIEVTKEVFTVLEKTDRKIEYCELDLKVERYIYNKKGELIRIIPSREDSYDRLQSENAQQFADDSESVEEIALRNLRYEQLHNAISLLKPNEQALIEALYFQFLSQRDYAQTMGVSQASVCKKQKRILKKLKNLLEK